MSDLRPTPARIALLRDVEIGEVWQKSNGHSTTVPDSTDWPGLVLLVVTSRIAEMALAGWVVLFTHTTGAKQWQLTTAGRVVLAENTKEKTDG